jgi:hypothetical protein
MATEKHAEFLLELLKIAKDYCPSNFDEMMAKYKQLRIELIV